MSVKTNWKNEHKRSRRNFYVVSLSPSVPSSASGQGERCDVSLAIGKDNSKLVSLSSPLLTDLSSQQQQQQQQRHSIRELGFQPSL
ncbi:mCG148452 [Mus musculus]|jgi:hypothetical protein|nr:mCG148452 [Mus musculus]